jgi:hypothetical protein
VIIFGALSFVLKAIDVTNAKTHIFSAPNAVTSYVFRTLACGLRAEEAPHARSRAATSKSYFVAPAIGAPFYRANPSERRKVEDSHWIEEAATLETDARRPNCRRPASVHDVVFAMPSL